jgi:hypothetical protein
LVFVPALFAFATPNFVVGMERSIFGHAPARGTTANFTDVFPASMTSIG